MSIRARLANSPGVASSNRERWRFGSNQVSNGNLGAYGAIAAKSADSAITRDAVLRFLPDDVAEHAALFELMVALRAIQLFPHLARHDRQRNQLRMTVLERRACRRAVILEDDDMAQTDVALQVEHAIAPGPEHLLDRRLGHRRQRLSVDRRLDDDFVRANAVHPIEQPLAFAIEIAFDAQRRKLVRHDAHVPAGGVRRLPLRYARISGGVLFSCPSQNGQRSSGLVLTVSI